MNDEDVIAELRADIQLMGAAALLKIEGHLPQSFDIRTVSAYNDEAWRQGFRRCMAEVERLIKLAKDGRLSS